MGYWHIPVINLTESLNHHLPMWGICWGIDDVTWADSPPTDEGGWGLSDWEDLGSAAEDWGMDVGTCGWMNCWPGKGWLYTTVPPPGNARWRIETYYHKCNVITGEIGIYRFIYLHQSSPIICASLGPLRWKYNTYNTLLRNLWCLNRQRNWSKLAAICN